MVGNLPKAPLLAEERRDLNLGSRPPGALLLTQTSPPRAASSSLSLSYWTVTYRAPTMRQVL